MKFLLILLFYFFPFFGFAFHKPLSSNTDYFRSKQNGAWNNVNTWESSIDSIVWTNATLVPDINSTSITIKDSVFLTIGLPVDALYINNNGVLVNAITASGNNFTVARDALVDYDFIIKNGGSYLITSTVAFGSNTTLTGKTLVQTGGRIKVGNGVNIVGGNNHTYGINNTIYWEDDAIFQWNSPTPPSFTIGHTYFINAYANYTTPILLFSYPIAPSMGSTNQFYVHGRLETTAPITFGGTGIKTFRGGIVNNALLTFNSGKVIITNDQSYVTRLGGTAEIIANGEMDITGIDQFTLDVTNSKLITGNINLQNRALINLNNNTLTVNGAITGGSGDPELRFFNTNGTGALKILNIGTTPTTFPVGNVTIAAEIFNPVTIANSGVIDNFTVNVTQAFPPCLTTLQQQNSVEATWNISEDIAGGSNAQLTLTYGVDVGVQSNVGPSYASAAAKIVHCGTTTADYANGSVNGTTITGAGSGFTSFSPFGITSDPALLLFLPTQLKQFIAIPIQQNKTAIQFIIDAENNIDFYTIEHSIDGINYFPIQQINVNNSGNYNYIHETPIKATIYYRLKINTKQNNIHYSTIQKVQFKNSLLYVSALYPIPAKNNLTVSLFSYKTTKAIIQVKDVNGKIIIQQPMNLINGINTKQLDISSLNKGVFLIKVKTADSEILEKVIKYD